MQDGTVKIWGSPVGPHRPRSAIAAKAKAEAEQMAMKAEAYREYREAAMVEMLLDTLPKVG